MFSLPPLVDHHLQGDPTTFPDPHTTAFPSKGRGSRDEISLELTVQEAIVRRTGHALVNSPSCAERRLASCSNHLFCVSFQGLIDDPGATHHPGMELGKLCALGVLFRCPLTGRFPEGPSCRSGNECGQEEQQVC